MTQSCPPRFLTRAIRTLQKRLSNGGGALGVWLGLLTLLGMWGSDRASGAVTVFRNATKGPVRFQAISVGRSPQEATIETGDSRPVFFQGNLSVRFANDRSTSPRSVQPYSAYDILPLNDGGAVRLSEIPLGQEAMALVSSDETRLPRNELSGANIITVKVFVDDDEVRRRAAWEPTLRQRIADASEVLKAHSGVEMRIVDFGTWDSDDRERDFGRSLSEFEREGSRGSAQVAIGFTSQYQMYEGRFHMGGTRGPLHTHILVKERARGILETERLELLIHEVGHFLGATHSAEPTSVMRPLLDRGRLRRVGSRVRFDPANTLLIAMIGEEIRFNRVREMTDVAPSTRRRMMAVCTALESKLPNDSAAAQIRSLLSMANASQIVDDTRKVLDAIVAVGELEKSRTETRGLEGAEKAVGDRLLELYVRRAATATRLVEGETAPHAMLLALGIAFDDTDTLKNNFATRGLVQRVEDASARTRRLAALGMPTMRGRGDLTKHFFVSAHATALLGGAAAQAAGLLKETFDAQGGSGFSFADMQANLAGIAFANAVLTGSLKLEELEKSFSVEDFLPSSDGLPEGLTAAKFSEDFGSLRDPRAQVVLRDIHAAIRELPAYTRTEAGAQR